MDLCNHVIFLQPTGHWSIFCTETFLNNGQCDQTSHPNSFTSGVLLALLISGLHMAVPFDGSQDPHTDILKGLGNPGSTF